MGESAFDETKLSCQLQSLIAEQAATEEEIAKLQETLQNDKQKRIALQLENVMIERFRHSLQRSIDAEEEPKAELEEDIAREVNAQTSSVRAFENKILLVKLRSTYTAQKHSARTQRLITQADQEFQQTIHTIDEEQHSAETNEAHVFAQREQFIEQMHKGFNQHLEKLREKFQRALKEMRHQCNNELADLTRDLELREHVFIHETEERKNQHIHELIDFHHESFKNLKAYYSEITHGNLDAIMKLRSENEQTKQNNKRLKKDMEVLVAQNNQIIQPLREQHALKAKLQAQLRFFEKDQLSLKNLRRKNIQVEEGVKQARARVRSLEQQDHRLDRSIGTQERELNGISRTLEDVVGSGVYMHFKSNDLLKHLDKANATLRMMMGQPETLGVSFLLGKEMLEVVKATIFEENEELFKLRNDVQKHVCMFNDMLNLVRTRLTELSVPHEHIKEECIGPTRTHALPIGSRVVEHPSKGQEIVDLNSIRMRTHP